MSNTGLNLSDLRAKLDGAVNGATDFVDLADKVANELSGIASHLPGVGPDVALAVGALNVFDKVLHEVKGALGA